MIMMPYGCPWPSPQLTGHADFWHPTAQAGLAVVVSHRRAARRCGPLLAGILAPLRPGAHVPAVQAGPGMDRTQDPRPSRRGPVDLADHRRLCPALARPAARCGPALALGTARPAGPADPGPGPPRIPEHPRCPALPGPCAKTRQTRPRQATRISQPQARTPLRRGENLHKGTHTPGQARTRRLNNKLGLGTEPGGHFHRGQG